MTKTILIVEDHPDALEYFEEVLAEQGYAVLTADNGRRGLELAQSSRPDAVILDVVLPQMSGREIHDALRADPASQELPILFITAEQGEDVSDLVDDRHTFYMKKALDVQQLMSLLERSLRR
ncbi:MAG TPA: response regulator [Stenomitos sp.]